MIAIKACMPALCTLVSWETKQLLIMVSIMLVASTPAKCHTCINVCRVSVGAVKAAVGVAISAMGAAVDAAVRAAVKAKSHNSRASRVCSLTSRIWVV